jgi:hypothetical protein
MEKEYLLKESMSRFLDSQFSSKIDQEDSLSRRMAVEEFKKKLHDLYLSTESPPQYTKIQDNIREIILSDRIREDEVNTYASY